MKYLLALALLASPLQGQTPAHTIVADSVRAFLALEWDKHASNPYQVERVYCVGFKSFRHKVTGTWLFEVNAIRPAKVTYASQRRVYYKPCGETETVIHIHTNTTCITDQECEMGGVEAWNCEESDIDKATLAKSDAPFAGVQCSREAVAIFYHPALKPAPKIDGE
jgi:hypothetical protein